MQSTMNVTKATNVEIDPVDPGEHVIRFWFENARSVDGLASVYLKLEQLDEITAQWADIRQAAEHDDLVKAGVDA